MFPSSKVTSSEVKPTLKQATPMKRQAGVCWTEQTTDPQILCLLQAPCSKVGISYLSFRGKDVTENGRARKF
jgi:hypothetical protein